MMNWYKDEAKEMFLKDIFGDDASDIARKRYNDLFTEITPIEQAFNEDISEFTDNQLSGLLEYISTSYEAFLKKRKMLTAYIVWNRKIPVSRRPRQIKFDDLDLTQTMKSAYVPNIEALSDKAELVFGDDLSTGVFYKACLYLVFLGYDAKEIVNMRKTDIDFDKCVVYRANAMFSVSGKCLETLHSCATVKSFDTVDALNRPLLYDICNNEYLIRKRRNNGTDQDKPCDVSYVYRSFEILNSKLGTNYSHHSIRKSGFFYWLQSHETSSGIKLAEDKKYYQELSEKYWGVNSEKFGRIIHDYYQWVNLTK